MNDDGGIDVAMIAAATIMCSDAALLYQLQKQSQLRQSTCKSTCRHRRCQLSGPRKFDKARWLISGLRDGHTTALRETFPLFDAPSRSPRRQTDILLDCTS